MNNGMVLRNPECEVIIRLHGSDVLVAGVFSSKGDRLDIVLGVEKQEVTQFAADLFRELADALPQTNWFTLSDDDTSTFPPWSTSDGVDDIPF